MEPLRGAVSDQLSVRADDLFRLISTVDLLPEWNERIHRVWELYPKTFWRKVLFSKMRHRQLKEEVRDSLEMAERVAVARRGPSRPG